MNFFQFLGDIVFPRSCVSCGDSLNAGVVCAACHSAIPMNDRFFCIICDARLPYGKKTCHKNAPCILGAATSYQDPTVKSLVRRLKFQGIREAAVPLAEIMAQYFINSDVFPLFSVIPAQAGTQEERRKNSPWVPACAGMTDFLIIPLPLSKQRRRERGFNQSEEIAKELAKKMATTVTMTPDALVRTRHAKAQSETQDLRERLSNVEGCFHATPAVKGKTIILIDDVTTSGATFREAAGALKKAGARTIIALAAAKA